MKNCFFIKNKKVRLKSNSSASPYKIKENRTQKLKIEKSKNVLQKGLKQEIEKHIKDPVFMALVKKYAKESEEFNKNKSKIDNRDNSYKKQ